jgi:spermidine synthase
MAMKLKEIPRWTKLLFFSVTALGISSIITQLIVMRELLSVFHGNELVIGVIFGTWLLLTGAGAWFGRYLAGLKDKIRFLILSQIFVAILPFLHLFIIRSLRTFAFPAGASVGVVTIFFTSLLLLLPYCVISGSLLTLFCVIYTKREDPGAIGKVYFIDSIGDILGGLLFSFVLVFLLNHFQIAYIILFLNLSAALLVSFFGKRRFFRILSIIVLVVFSVFIIVDFNRLTVALQYPGQEVVFNSSSRYGSLVVTRTGDQLNFFENGIILFSTQNTIANEETVHYAMVQHESPRKVLLISGGAAGTTSEILKYGPERIDYVELDPLVIDIGRRFTSNLDDDRIRTISMDARQWVKQAGEDYDVVIMDLPDPSTAQINRFYTDEFFKELKGTIAKGAVVSLKLSSQENYMAREARELNASVFNTLKNNFEHVIVIPGDVNRFIASEGELTYDIASRIEKRNIQTEWVNRYWLPAKLTEDRIRRVLDAVGKKDGINRDFSPITYYYYLRFWISQFSFNYYMFFALTGALIVLYLVRMKPVPFAVFTTGFTGASLEVVLLIGFQILYGYVYQKIGVIVTAFMIGLAVGSWVMNRRLEKTGVGGMVLIESLLILSALLVPAVLLMIGKLSSIMLISVSTQVLIPLLTTVVAFLVGAEFPLASKLHFKSVSHTAAALYNADLFGACIGALLVSAFLIPFLGLVTVCGIVASVNAASLFVVLCRRRALCR